MCLLPVQFLMLRAIVRPVIKPFFRRQFHSIDEFDVRTFVDLVGMTRGKIRNEKSHRSARLLRQWLALEPINDQCPIGHGVQWNARVKIVRRRVQAQIFSGRLRLHELPEGRTYGFGLRVNVGIER